MFREHFGAQLGGSCCNFEALLGKCLDDLTGVSLPARSEGAPSVVPGISELAKLFKKAILGAGGDRISGK